MARHMLTNGRPGLGSEGKPHAPPWAGYRTTVEAMGGIGNLGFPPSLARTQ